MVTASPEQLRKEALDFFREPELPESLKWVADLSPVHARLFAVELADAIKSLTLTEDLAALLVLVEGWEATAELDSAPEVVARIDAAKQYRNVDL